MAFGYFTPMETDRIAGKAAALHGAGADRVLRGREVSPFVYEYGEMLDAVGRACLAEPGGASGGWQQQEKSGLDE